MQSRKFPLLIYLLFLILVGSSLVLGVVLISNRSLMSRTLFENQKEKFDTLTLSAIEQADSHLKNVEEVVVQNILELADEDKHSKKAISERLIRTLEAHPSIFGTLFIYTKEEYEKTTEKDFQEIYVWRDGEKIKHTNYRQDLNKDYQAYWYTEPIKQKKAVWSKPYYDRDVKVLMVTYSIPIFKKDGNIEGVITADISLNWLTQFIESQTVGTTGSQILIYNRKTIIENTVNCWDADGNLREVKPDPKYQPMLNELAKTIEKSPFGSFRFRRPLENDYAWMYFCELRRLNWTVGFVLPENDVLGVVAWMNRRTIGYGALGLLFLIPLSFLIARSVARPLRKLSEAVRDVSGGHFDIELPRPGAQKEINDLISSFDIMRSDLKRYIGELTEQEWICAQLSVAHSIQLGMVPKEFDGLKNRGIDLYALLEPALDVGGDLYDFLFLDNDHLYFCIGDVSGKGVPASLFMTAGRTLIRSALKFLKDPAKAFSYVNWELSQTNEGGLFITALCGIYDLKTGDILICNAGHCFPFIIGADGSNEIIKFKPNLPLAVMEDFKYKNETFHLKKGDTLLVYTDGATDAVDLQDHFIMEKGLHELATHTNTDNMKTYVLELAEKIHLFAKGAKQSDDITLMAFKDIGKPQ